MQPQGGQLASVDALYGDDYAAVPSGVAQSPVAPTTTRSPHDRSDKGPSGWLEDPNFWLTLAVAVGAGVIGFRFHWGPGAKVSGSIDVADEFSSIVGHVFLSIAGIATFKLLASKTNIKALQEFAAFV